MALPAWTPSLMLLIDTYNVLHVTGVLPPDLAGLDVPHLLDLLANSRYRNRRAVLVCDGEPKPDEPTDLRGRHTIRHSGAGRSADALIVDEVNRSSAPRRLVVVSSDGEIRRAARKRRCRTLSSDQFLRQLRDDSQHEEARRSTPAPRPVAASRPQVRAWLERFGVSEDDIARIEREVDVSLILPGSAEAEPSLQDDAAAAREPCQLSEPRQPPEPLLPEELIEEATQMLREAEAMSGQVGKVANQGAESAAPPGSDLPSLPESVPMPSSPADTDDGVTLPLEVIAEAEAMLREAGAIDAARRDGPRTRGG